MLGVGGDNIGKPLYLLLNVTVTLKLLQNSYLKIIIVIYYNKVIQHLHHFKNCSAAWVLTVDKAEEKSFSGAETDR